MGITAEELKKEKEYLKEVREILKVIIEKRDNDLKQKKQNITEMKKFMYENAHDFTDEEIMIEMLYRDNEVDITNTNIDALERLKKSLASPYFGKVVFENNNLKKVLDIYIGMNTVMNGSDFYVFDWRSPISSLFYNYELGRAEYEAPMGKIKGDIINKRQFKIENGKLLRCFDSSINIEDDFLQEVLSKQSTDKMENIVSTIQKEQNKIIRNNLDKFLVVQGVAGSGKTAVALHRIAFLLYSQKDLDSNNVLILSPNDLFSNYISGVLPELGEQNVMTTTFNEFCKSVLKSKKVESFTDYLERAYNIDDNSNEIIKRKMADSFKYEIDNFYNQYIEDLEFEKNVIINDKNISISSLNSLFKEKWKDRDIETKLEFITDRVCDNLRLKKRDNSKNVYKSIVSSLNKSIDPIHIYNEFLKSNGLKELDKDNIFYEDITPLIYLNIKLGKNINYPKIKQVIIDEAQDYSMLQIEILNKIFPKASFTILGDINQTINPNYEYDSLESLKAIREDTNYLELNKTYRSSEEIIEYSNNVLGLNNICAIRHNNNNPVEEMVVKKSDISTKIPRLLSQMEEKGFKRNAIITKNKEEAVLLSKELKDMNNISLVTEHNNRNTLGNMIVQSYMAKGLEFDGVIVYTDQNNPYLEKEKNLYYVALTRAQHKLIVCNQPKVKKKKK